VSYARRLPQEVNHAGRFGDTLVMMKTKRRGSSMGRAAFVSAILRIREFREAKPTR
jgi:hypothetical protein